MEALGFQALQHFGKVNATGVKEIPESLPPVIMATLNVYRQNQNRSKRHDEHV